MNKLLWTGIISAVVVILVGVALFLMRRLGPFLSGGVNKEEEETTARDIRERTTSETRIDKNVQFTVYRPATIVPEKEYTLLAFAHLTKRREGAPQSEPDPLKEVQRLAAKVLIDQPAKYEPAKLDQGFPVRRRGFLLFVPKIEGCSFNPPTQRVQWLNSVQKVEFGMTASAEVDGRDVEGQMTIYLDGIYLTEIPIRITVDSTFVIPESQQGVLEETSAEPYRKIFASYSRKDTEIVEDFEAYVEALGDEYLRDVRNIRAGEVWSEKLEELIRDASIFQLFWSSNSMTSDFVKQEWEYALGLNRERFVRPVYWEDPRPERKPDLPPPSLDRLEFYKLPVDEEEEHAAVPPVRDMPDDVPNVHPQVQPSPATPVQRGTSLSLSVRSTSVKLLLSIVTFAALAAVVFVDRSGGPGPPACSDCIPSPMPTPSPFASSAISVRIEPAVIRTRKNIGTYVVEVANESSDVIEQVLIRQNLRKDVEYLSSSAPVDSDKDAISLSVRKIFPGQSSRVRVTIRMLGRVKPGEIYAPEHTTVTYLDGQGNRREYSQQAPSVKIGS